MSELVIPDEFLDAVVATQCGLTPPQVKFLRLIKRGAICTVPEEHEHDQDIQDLLAELKRLHEKGVVPTLEVILK